jgi:hypothetical protein
MFSASQLGLDPFELHLMGREHGFDEEGNDIGPVNRDGKPLAGKPKDPARYQRFLMACAFIAFEHHAKASGAQLEGTDPAENAAAQARRNKMVGQRNR